jgi:Domain of unknown function (DUF5666)
MKRKHLAWIGCAGLVIALTACNGGGSSDTSSSTQSGAAAATSSGVITAFGSVFVDGHEFSTAGAKVIDDDSGDTSTSTAGLEVGMVVDVMHSDDGHGTNPIASELHVHPLARGYVDASDMTAGTLTVMGQTVQITPATIFSDHRACVSTNACTAISGQSDVTATTGSAASAVAGTFVTIHGYLFSASAGAANIVATLVSAADAPTDATSGVHFKAEGVVTSTAGSGSSSITIGALNIDLSSARCYVSGEKTGCAGAFDTGQVVSAYADTAPSLPATTFAADGARLSSKIPVDVSGASVEIEGAVSSVTASPAAFVLRGVNIDASALPAGASLPAVGDIVRVLGTVPANGQSVTATSVTILHAARNAGYGFEGDMDVSSITSGTADNTYVVTLLGQNITVTSDTRLADHSARSWYSRDLAINPFNITTFVSYLQASVSQHLIVCAEADASGNLTAQSLIIVPPSTVSGIAGIVDGTPQPFNSSTTGTPSTFDVHGVAISADPSAVLKTRTGKLATVAAGDQVVVFGTFATGTLTVTAPPSFTDVVIDRGVPKPPVPMRGESF